MNHTHPTHHTAQQHTHTAHSHHKKVKKSHIIGILSIGAILCVIAIGYLLYSNPNIFKADVIRDEVVVNTTSSKSGNTYSATKLVPPEEHESYISSIVRTEDSIMTALVNNSEVNCFVNDTAFGTTTVDFSISMKDGLIRIDLSDIKEAGLLSETSLIANNEGYWVWSSDSDYPSGYTNFTDPSDKVNLILVALDPFASDPKVYSNSCTEGSVANSRFELPEGVDFGSSTPN